MIQTTPHIIESALLLLAAFVVGCLIGYALKRVFGMRQAPSSGKMDSQILATARPPAQDAPIAGRETVETKPSDLKNIKGIGPKVESLLNQSGIYSYRQIAAWSDAEIAAFDERLSLRGRISRDDWVGQAKMLTSAGRE